MIVDSDVSTKILDSVGNFDAPACPPILMPVAGSVAFQSF
jgi:hypothetical protein